LATKLLAKKIAKLTLTKKAADVSVLDLRKLSDVTDFFILCSGDSDTQVRAIANAVIDGTTEGGLKPWHSEGMSNAEWVIIDYVDVVVHVFQRNFRSYYNLEKLWGDAPSEKLADKPKNTTTKKTVTVRKKKVAAE
jgi:ribosome-associated protein